MRSAYGILLAAGAIAVLAAPSVAEDPAPAGGRYSVAPEADGFIRLDTLTGSVTQCRKIESQWTCRPAYEDASAVALEVRTLVDKVAMLDSRLAALEKAQSAQKAQATPSATTAPDKSPNLPDRLVGKLLTLVAALKHGRASNEGARG